MDRQNELLELNSTLQMEVQKLKFALEASSIEGDATKLNDQSRVDLRKQLEEVNALRKSDLCCISNLQRELMQARRKLETSASNAYESKVSPKLFDDFVELKKANKILRLQVEDMKTSQRKYLRGVNKGQLKRPGSPAKTLLR